MFRNCNSCSNETNNNSIYEDNNIQLPCNQNSCRCGFENSSGFPTNWMYAHSYVVNQRMNQIYTPEVGLKIGTIFPELVSPYCPNQSLEEINFLKNSNTIGGGCNS